MSPFEFFGRSAATRCFSVRAVQLPRCFSCGQGRAAPLLLFVRAVQLFLPFRGNRPGGGARWVDVTSPLWATDTLTNRHIQTPVFSESTVFAHLDRIVSLHILSGRLSSNSCSAVISRVLCYAKNSLFCFRPFPEVTLLARRRWRGAVMSLKKEKKKKEKKNIGEVPIHVYQNQSKNQWKVFENNVFFAKQWWKIRKRLVGER